jgi:hypothetical protein
MAASYSIFSIDAGNMLLNYDLWCQVSGFNDLGIEELRDLGIVMTEYLQSLNS